MRVAVTGTPGTGKTTATDLVETDLEVIHLNEIIEEAGFHEGRDEERGSLIADMRALREWFGDRDDVLVESHLAHRLPVERVVVLRCHPDVLASRLRERGENELKASENAEAEALDVILSEAVSAVGLENVYEIDTTDRTPGAVAAAIEAVLAGERDPSAGAVDFIDYL
jgi:adenylate kinase